MPLPFIHSQLAYEIRPINNDTIKEDQMCD